MTCGGCRSRCPRNEPLPFRRHPRSESNGPLRQASHFLREAIKEPDPWTSWDSWPPLPCGRRCKMAKQCRALSRANCQSATRVSIHWHVSHRNERSSRWGPNLGWIMTSFIRAPHFGHLTSGTVCSPPGTGWLNNPGPRYGSNGPRKIDSQLS